MELTGLNIVVGIILFMLVYYASLTLYPIFRFVFPKLITMSLRLMKLISLLFLKILEIISFSDRIVWKIEVWKRNAYFTFNKWISSTASKGSYRDRKLYKDYFKPYRRIVLFIMIAVLAGNFFIPAAHPLSKYSLEALADEHLNELNLDVLKQDPNVTAKESEGSYRLKSTYKGEKLKGGSLREEPVADINVDNIIRSISPNDVLNFYGEKAEKGSIVWYKLETQSGETGWISENIIEKIN